MMAMMIVRRQCQKNSQMSISRGENSIFGNLSQCEPLHNVMVKMLIGYDR